MKKKQPKIEKLEPLEIQKVTDIKKSIREGFELYKRAFKKARKPEDSPDPAIFDLDHSMQERRSKALLVSVERFVKYDLLEEWLFLNITTDGYARLEHDFHLLFAASIWILDRYSKVSNDFEELFKLLPRDSNEVYDSLYLPEVWDCCYNSDLISSVEYVLHYRNADISELEYDGLEGERIFTSNLSAQGKDHANVPSKQRFEKLISLIPQENIDTAVRNFTEYFSAWVDRLFNCLKPLEDRRNITREKVNELRERINDAQASAEKAFKELKAEEKRKPAKPSKTPFALTAKKMPDLIGDLSDIGLSKHTERGNTLHDQIDSLIEKLDRLYEEHDKLCDELREHDQKIHQLAYFIRNAGYLEYDLCLKRYGKEVADAMVKLPTPDPYEMCFAFLYLIEQNNDLVWLYGACRGVMLEVCQHLPWAVREYDEMEDPVWDEEHTSDRKPADIPDWYSLDYYAKDDIIARNLAQIVYEETGCIMPRDLHKYDSNISKLRKYGIRQNKAIAMLYCMTMLGHARRSWKSLNFEDDYMDYIMSENEDKYSPAAQVPQITKTEEQKEIEKLKSALHAAERSASEAKKKLAEQKAAAEAEHRELADLRELLFRGKEENDENEPAADESIFPYEVQRDTVIFGGHESWVKGLKTLLKGAVRFVSKELLFDISIIRSAEVIWIQTNAIPHKAYNRIVDAARKQGKPVRYFLYASAAKCAEQVAENDLKH